MDRYQALVTVLDLMRDDQETFKVGYSGENAVRAVQDVYNVSDEDVDFIRETLRGAGRL